MTRKTFKSFVLLILSARVSKRVLSPRPITQRKLFKNEWRLHYLTNVTVNHLSTSDSAKERNETKRDRITKFGFLRPVYLRIGLLQ